MASFGNLLPAIFLLFLTNGFLFPIHAREHKFFSKASRYKPSKDTTAVPQETPAVEKEQPATLPSQSQHGYGLYGRGPDEFQTTTATTNNKHNYNSGDAHYNVGGVPPRFPDSELSTENYVTKESNTRDQNYHNYYNSNARDSAGNLPSESSNSQFNGAASYANREYRAMYPGNAYENEQYGMSDTRFLENGRYFYDVNAERYRRGYDPTGEQGVYYQHGARDSNYGYRGYNYGGQGNAYEYKNDHQEEYVP